MNQQLKKNLTSGEIWMRCLYMVFFAVCLGVSRFVMWAVVVLQFLFALITGGDNVNLRQFGDTLSQYIFQSLKFLTFNSEEKPFPFADWPTAESDVMEGEVETAEEIARAKEADSEEASSEEGIAEEEPTEAVTNEKETRSEDDTESEKA